MDEMPIRKIITAKLPSTNQRCILDRRGSYIKSLYWIIRKFNSSGLGSNSVPQIYSRFYSYTICFQGIEYIHRSPIQFHGYLQSSTCYVDNRWNVKLGHFGLREFCSGERKLENYPNEEEYYRGLCTLWYLLFDNAQLINHSMKQYPDDTEITVHQPHCFDPGVTLLVNYELSEARSLT